MYASNSGHPQGEGQATMIQVLHHTVVGEKGEGGKSRKDDEHRERQWRTVDG